MTEVTCYWRGTDEPRGIRNRHIEDCEDDQCKGCQDCPEFHCIICGIEHVNEQTCPECVGTVRDGIVDIQSLYKQLPSQAAYGGQDGRLEASRPLLGGEAMVLMGPGSGGKAVAWSRERGDDVSHLFDERIGEMLPPEHAMISWEDDWRSITDQAADPNKRATLIDACQYLDAHLTWAAQHHDAFDEFAKDVREQVGRLEDVLHDGERIEYGAPCWKCNATLERVCHKRKGLQDEYWCPRCKRTYKGDQYRYIVNQTARDNAVSLPAKELSQRFDVEQATIRKWAERGLVRKDGAIDGKMFYRIKDVKKLADGEEVA